MAKLRHEYNESIKQLDPHLLTKESTVVDVSAILTMGIDKVQTLMEGPQGDAYERGLVLALKEWDQLWKDLVHEIQIANPEWYPLNPQ